MQPKTKVQKYKWGKRVNMEKCRKQREKRKQYEKCEKERKKELMK
jgi:hypothetical protein